MSENLAGIIPVAGHESDIRLPWHHVLMPYDKDKTLLQHAVYNCAMAGCSSIWIVCNDDQQPLVRKLVGDKVEDPVYKYRPLARNAYDHKRFIPIFYCAMPIRDQQLRPHIAWAAVFGSLLARKTLGGVSKYTAPTHFFVCWPYCVINSKALRPARKELQKKALICVDKGRSVLTNDLLPIVIQAENVEELRKHCYGLPTAKEFANLNISRVLAPLHTINKFDADFDYKKVSTWHEYCNYFK